MPPPLHSAIHFVHEHSGEGERAGVMKDAATLGGALGGSVATEASLPLMVLLLMFTVVLHPLQRLFHRRDQDSRTSGDVASSTIFPLTVLLERVRLLIT